jgi:fused signal recognition particle receptor
LIDQIELFDKIVGIDGMILTKTDTDERPGSIVTAAYSIDKPIYYLGIGQGYDDLVKFDAKIVAEKLFEIDDED